MAATYTCSPSSFGHTVSGDLLKEFFYYGVASGNLELAFAEVTI